MLKIKEKWGSLPLLSKIGLVAAIVIPAGFIIIGIITVIHQLIIKKVGR